MRSVRNKALTPEQNDVLRAIVRDVIDRQFGGVVSVAAQATPKISHSLLFEFLDGRRGAGMKLLEWISARTDRGMDDLLGRSGRPSAGGGSSRPVARNITGWKHSATIVAKTKKWIPHEAIEAVGETAFLLAPERITPQFIIEHAQAWMNTIGEEKIAQLDAARVEAEIREMEARYEAALAMQREMLARGETPPHIEDLMEQLARTAKTEGANDADSQPPAPASKARRASKRK